MLVDVRALPRFHRLKIARSDNRVLWPLPPLDSDVFTIGKDQQQRPLDARKDTVELNGGVPVDDHRLATRSLEHRAGPVSRQLRIERHVAVATKKRTENPDECRQRTVREDGGQVWPMIGRLGSQERSHGGSALPQLPVRDDVPRYLERCALRICGCGSQEAVRNAARSLDVRVWRVCHREILANGVLFVAPRRRNAPAHCAVRPRRVQGVSERSGGNLSVG